MVSSVIFWGLVSFYWATTLWDLYLNYRQFKVHLENVDRPEEVAEFVTEDDYAKARLYELDNHRFGFVCTVYNTMQTSVVLLYDVKPWLWQQAGHWVAHWIVIRDDEILRTIVFYLAYSLIFALTALPFSFYSNFVIEQKHGFNRKTIAFFFKDEAKEFMVDMVTSAPIIAAEIAIVKVFETHFVLYLWLFSCMVDFFFTTIHPIFIAPLFDKYVSLPEGRLKQKIEILAKKLKFPLKKIFVVQGSKRSSHSNAYMYGFWNGKRIVLYDTLLSQEWNEKLKKEFEPNQCESSGSESGSETVSEGDQCDENGEEYGLNDDEVMAVLHHELGHWKLGHTLVDYIISQVASLFHYAVFALVYRYKPLYSAFGYDCQPIFVGMNLVSDYVMAPFDEIYSVAMAFLSRWNESSADNFAADMGCAKPMCSALIKLDKDNLSLPVDDPLYAMVSFSHPPLKERVDAMKKYQ